MRMGDQDLVGKLTPAAYTLSRSLHHPRTHHTAAHHPSHPYGVPTLLFLSKNLIRVEAMIRRDE